MYKVQDCVSAVFAATLLHHFHVRLFDSHEDATASVT